MRARSRARRCAVQALYQWQLTGAPIADIDIDFLAGDHLDKVDVPYYQTLLLQTSDHVVEIDALLKPCVDRSLDGLDPVERAVLRLGVCELKFHPDIPYRVVINEAVELAKVFGAENSHKFVNGVLDKLAKTLRRVEMTATDKGAG